MVPGAVVTGFYRKRPVGGGARSLPLPVPYRRVSQRCLVRFRVSL